MNFMDLSLKLNGIERAITLTKIKLKYDNSFPNETRIEFNKALEELLDLLIKDRLSCFVRVC